MRKYKKLWSMGNFIKIASDRDYEDKPRYLVKFSNDGSNWTCISLSKKELKKLRKEIKEFLLTLK